jgi:hypothetical protein
VTLRTFFAYLLTHVPAFQCFDQFPAKEKRNQQRGDSRVGGAERDVLKNVESFYEEPILLFEVVVNDLVKDEVNHFLAEGGSLLSVEPYAFVSSPIKGKFSFSALTTLSVATPREPLTKIKSPARTSLIMAVAASVDDSKNRVADNPAAFAP